MLKTGERKLAVVRGGGDLGTGVIYRLWRSHFKVLVLEIERPMVVRVNVSAANAVFCKEADIEGMPVRRIDSMSEFDMASYDVEVLVSPNTEPIKILKPYVVIDAIMAKRNTGTTKNMADIVIGIGPGFTAPDDVHAVIETKRGHYLGRAIYDGSAIPNTGIPGIVRGFSIERLLRSPCAGYVRHLHNIGDSVSKDEIVAFVGNTPVRAGVDGVLRGLIHPTVPVETGMKIGDVDPSGEREHCFTITDKALAIGGGVLEAIACLGTN